jgi:cyclic beta-1,2-glucan synthetase
VLGEHRAGNMPHVVTEVDLGSGALLARNAYNGEFRGPRRVPRLQRGAAHVSGDRARAPRPQRQPARPGVHPPGAPVGPGRRRPRPVSGDAGRWIDLADGQEREIVFTFGSGRDLGDARTLIHALSRRRGRPGRRSRRTCGQHWNDTLGAVHVETPTRRSTSWPTAGCTYQVLAARMWGRSGFYQSGGAFGFRDQLQDAMALVHAEPGAAARADRARGGAPVPRGRRAALVAPADGARRPHPHLRRLPVAAVRVCRYVAAVGDTGVLDEQVGLPRGPRGQARRGQLLRPAGALGGGRRRSTSTACAPSSTACASASTACR